MSREEGISGAIMAPHPPLIVPDVGRGQEGRIRDTVDGYRRAAALMAEWRPETIVVLSPHALMYRDYFHISPGREARGDFGLYMAPEISVCAAYDQELVREIIRQAKKLDFPMGDEGEREPQLDHGTMIPLYFINQYYRDYKIVRVGGSGLSFEAHYRAGEIIAGAARKLGRRIAVVGSGDLSHKLKSQGPYGYSPQGPEYDRRLMDVMGRGAFGELLEFSESFCEKAGECGHRSFTTMAGILDGLSVKAERLSYEGPFGVGYGVCVFQVMGEDPERRFLQRRLKLQRGESGENRGAEPTGGNRGKRNLCEKPGTEPTGRAQEEEMPGEMTEKEGDGGKEDAYVALARKSLEFYVRTGRLLSFKKARAQLPEELLEQRAGVFVSIEKGGALRGCIGTICPVCENVAQEIISNAVSAGIHDPRFPSVREEELGRLVYSVDVLGETEAVNGPEDLDAKRYGVIVSKGRRRGLLLPNLEGVDTVEKQISIAKQKAGIGPDEHDVELERFEVIRHGDKG